MGTNRGIIACLAKYIAKEMHSDTARITYMQIKKSSRMSFYMGQLESVSLNEMDSCYPPEAIWCLEICGVKEIG